MCFSFPSLLDMMQGCIIALILSCFVPASYLVVSICINPKSEHRRWRIYFLHTTKGALPPLPPVGAHPRHPLVDKGVSGAPAIPCFGTSRFGVCPEPLFYRLPLRACWMSWLMYRPLLGTLLRYSQLSLSTLKDIIFCVLSPRAMPAFLTLSLCSIIVGF